MVLNKVSDREEISKELLSLFWYLSKDPDMVWGIVPTNDDIKTKKMNDQALDKLIPHLYQSFPVREYAEHEELGEGICDLSSRSMLLLRKRSS